MIESIRDCGGLRKRGILRIQVECVSNIVARMLCMRSVPCFNLIPKRMIADGFAFTREPNDRCESGGGARNGKEATVQ